MKGVGIVLCLFWILVVVRAQYYPPNVTEIIRFYGYPCYDYAVPTPDGWVLNMQRIPNGINAKSTASKGVVYFQHGLNDASVGSVLNFPLEGLPFILADAGYDVWLGNNRGNGYSMTNNYYTPDQSGFWNFSWDEMAMYDFPSQINFVLQTTGYSQLTYIGHSEGTIQAFAGFLLDPSLADKVNIFIALAPVAYVGNIESLVLKAAADLDTEELLELLGVNEFYLPAAIEKLLPGICNIDPEICAFTMDAIMGPNSYLNESRIAYYVHYEPNPTSVKNMAHWAQGVATDTYQMYDYGSAQQNMLHYNQTTPPAYDITKMPTNLNIALFCGGLDYLADPTDVARLVSLLPVKPFQHYEPTYAHLDPLWGYLAYEQIYPIVLNLTAEATAGRLNFKESLPNFLNDY